MGVVEALWDVKTQVNIVSDLAAALDALKTRCMTRALIGDVPPRCEPVGRIAGYYQACATPTTSPILLTFCVLSAFYLFPACRAQVATSTPSNYAAYFQGNNTVLPFEARFERHLAGGAGWQAKTPAEIVVAERQLLMVL